MYSFNTLTSKGKGAVTACVYAHHSLSSREVHNSWTIYITIVTDTCKDMAITLRSHMFMSNMSMHRKLSIYSYTHADRQEGG